jgi:hypothetical protein
MKILKNLILQKLPKNQNWRFFDTKFEKPITKRDIKKIKKTTQQMLGRINSLHFHSPCDLYDNFCLNLYNEYNP